MCGEGTREEKADVSWSLKRPASAHLEQGADLLVQGVGVHGQVQVGISKQRQLLLVEGQELLGAGLLACFVTCVRQQGLLVIVGCLLMMAQCMLARACKPEQTMNYSMLLWSQVSAACMAAAADIAQPSRSQQQICVEFYGYMRMEMPRQPSG